MLPLNAEKDKVIRKKVKREPPLGLHSYDWELASESTARRVSDETLVQQSFKDEVDINTIVRRYGITGQMPYGNAAGVFGDFTEVTDLDSAVERVNKARAGFMTLPPEIRERFKNDPLEMWRQAQSLSDDAFEAQMRMPEPVVAPDPAPVSDVKP